jgi:NTE family protein
MIKTIIFGALILLSIIGFKFGISTFTPWLNYPEQIRSSPSDIVLGTGISDSKTENYSILVTVTMSGGGTRAAAFAYGVLEGLREAKIDWSHQHTDLLNEVDLVSGVSAGSILATYMTAFGPQNLSDFKQDFLYTNFQNQLILSALTFTNMVHLTSPDFGRGNLLVDQLNVLYKGKTFADLPVRPRLLVSATDLSKAVSFQFTPEQFSLICSDLNSVPLAFAVGASSSVPFIFSPISVKNYSGSEHCAHTSTINNKNSAQIDLRMRQLYKDKLTYLSSDKRPFVHLVDGALSDNLGLRSIMDRAAVGGNIGALVSNAPTHSIHRMVIVVINSEIDPLENIDRSGETPDVIEVASALRFSKGLSASAETIAMLEESAATWTEQLKTSEMNTPGNMFAADSQLHIVQVNLREIPDPVLRERLKSLPTVFHLPRQEVDDLILAGKQTLEASPAFKKLMNSFLE